MKQNPLNQYSNISPQSIHIINLIPMNYKKIILALTVATSILAGHAQQKEPVDYVNPLMGTDSKISLSNGNTYPAIARPWGMNFWMPQTGKMGDGWAYTYLGQNPRLQADPSTQSVDQ